MTYVTCAKCGTPFGAEDFATLHSELVWRGWAIVVSPDGAKSVFCRRCVETHQPRYKWSGVSLVSYADAIKRCATVADAQRV